MIHGPDIQLGFLWTGFILLPSSLGSLEAWPSPNEGWSSVVLPYKKKLWKWWSIPYSFKARKQDVTSLVLTQPIWQATWRCHVFLLYKLFFSIIFFIILKRLLESCMSEQRGNTYKKKDRKWDPSIKIWTSGDKTLQSTLAKCYTQSLTFHKYRVSTKKEVTGTFSYFVLIKVFSHRETLGETMARAP